MVITSRSLQCTDSVFSAKPLVKSVAVIAATRSAPASLGCEAFDVECAACVIGSRVQRLLHDTKADADALVEAEKRVGLQ